MEKQKLLDCDNPIDYEKGLSYLSNFFASSIKDITKDDMNTAINELRPKIEIRSGFDELYKVLKENNFDIFLTSGSPFECTRIINNRYKFDKCIALELCIEKNTYTGFHKGAMTSTQKLKILNSALPKYKKIFGVGNYRDLKLFSSFKFKFLINEKLNIIDASITKINKLTEIIHHLEKNQILNV